MKPMLPPLVLVALLSLSGILHAGDPEFLRGDVNGDGRVVPIQEVKALFSWGFGGGEEPPCFDAADVDNNGVVSTLNEVLYLLNWGFTGGDPPPAPGPEACGVDTGVSVGCDTSPDPCPGVAPNLVENDDYILAVSNELVAASSPDAMVLVTLDHTGDPIIGYQFGVCHGELVSLEEDAVDDGSAIEDFKLSVFYHSVVVEPSGFSVALISNLINEVTLESSVDPYELYEVTYGIVDAGTATLEFCDTLGDSALPVRVFGESGEEILPETQNGSLDIVPGNIDYVLSLSNEFGPVDSSETVTVSLTNTGDALDGYQFGVCHDDKVDLDEENDIQIGAAIADMDLTFQAINVFPGHWNVGAVFQVDQGEALAPGTDLELYLATYDLLEIGTSALEFCTNDLDPDAIVVVAAGDDVLPVTDNGSIEIVPSTEPRFLRGDMDGDGFTFALVDAIYLLRWAFEGQAAPPCMDAADANDNGAVFALIDAIYLLEYAFSDTEVPPAPGPTTCGADPTADDLDCLVPPDDCL